MFFNLISNFCGNSHILFWRIESQKLLKKDEGFLHLIFCPTCNYPYWNNIPKRLNREGKHSTIRVQLGCHSCQGELWRLRHHNARPGTRDSPVGHSWWNLFSLPLSPYRNVIFPRFQQDPCTNNRSVISNTGPTGRAWKIPDRLGRKIVQHTQTSGIIILHAPPVWHG